MSFRSALFFNLQRVLQGVIQFHDGCLVSTAVAVVWSTKDGHHVLVMAPVVTLNTEEHTPMGELTVNWDHARTRWLTVRVNLFSLTSVGETGAHLQLRSDVTMETLGSTLGLCLHPQGSQRTQLT